MFTSYGLSNEDLSSIYSSALVANDSESLFSENGVAMAISWACGAFVDDYD